MSDIDFAGMPARYRIGYQLKQKYLDLTPIKPIIEVNFKDQKSIVSVKQEGELDHQQPLNSKESLDPNEE